MSKILCAFFLAISIVASAQEGPFKRQAKAHLGQKIIHTIDNSTVGVIQTALGATHILMYAILNPIAEGRMGPRMELHSGENNEIVQVNIAEDIPWFSGAYSLGLFQVGDYAVEHEGGHSTASAALGPLYLPVVGASYLIEGHDASFMEDWADLEAKDNPYSITFVPQVGMGKVEMNGEFHNVAVFKFSIDQNQSTKYDDEMESHKILSWFNTNIVSPLAKHNNPQNLPTLVEFDLLTKRLNLVVDNIALYLGGDQEVKNNIQIDQKYFSFRSDPGLERIHMQALAWSVKYGFQYNLNKDVAFIPKVGVNASIDAFSNNEAYYNLGLASASKDLDWALSGGYEAGLEVRLYDYLSLETTYSKALRSNEFFSSSWESKLTNRTRNPLKNFNFLHYVEFSAGYKNQKWNLPSGSTKNSQIFISVGARF